MSVIIDGSAGVTTNTGAVYDSIQRATAQASTSGTSIDFTSIPSWVKRITVMFSGVSGSGTSAYRFQLGTSGGIVSSGYLGAVTQLATSTIATSQYSAGFDTTGPGATDTCNGSLIITNLTGNTWTVIGNFALGASTRNMLMGGSIALASALTTVRVTTVNGTDTFDAGTINILYE
jgi:hypothetical protein